MRRHRLAPERVLKVWDVSLGLGFRGSRNSGISAVAKSAWCEVAIIYIQVLNIRKLTVPVRGAGAMLPVGRRGGIPIHGFRYIP